MYFTVFLNSRGRVEQLKKFIEILEQKTKFKEKTELIITCDFDDEPTLKFLSEYKSKFKFVKLVGERPKSLCASFNNMASLAQGQYLLVMNDDAEIITDNWDELALSKINQFKTDKNLKDDIIYGFTYDNSVDKPQGKEYASFPIISKQAVNVLGFFMYDKFVGLGGDSSIYRVYKEVGRIVEIYEILIDHIYHNAVFKVMSPDKTAAEMRANTYQNALDPFTLNIEGDVKKLKDFIDKTNK